MGQLGGGVVSDLPTDVRYTKQHRLNIEYKFTIEYFAELSIELTFS